MFSLNDSMRYLLYNRPTDMRNKLLEAGTLGKPDSANDNEVCTNIEWRELVMIVEGIMEARDSRRTRLENLQKLRK